RSLVGGVERDPGDGDDGEETFGEERAGDTVVDRAVDLGAEVRGQLDLHADRASTAKLVLSCVATVRRRPEASSRTKKGQRSRAPVSPTTGWPSSRDSPRPSAGPFPAAACRWPPS